MSKLLTAAKATSAALRHRICDKKKIEGLRRFVCSPKGAVVFVALVTLLPHAVLAAACSTQQTQFNTGFTQLNNALDALADFFYGTFFKLGMMVAFVVSAVVLVLDDGNLGRVVQLVLRVVLIVAAGLGIASWIGTPSAC